MKNFILLFLMFNLVSVKAQETSKQFQDNLNKEYADNQKSPLTKEDLKEFKSLDFFPINDKYIVNAKFVRTKNEAVSNFKTTTVRIAKFLKYGELYFTIDGKELKLNVYQSMRSGKKAANADDLFLPFSDLSSGKESYLGGRYIDLKITKGTTWIIDFNKAYNPYCAYNHDYSCPAVPQENDLDVAILAGVKKFHD